MLEADQIDRRATVSEPETRQFNMDDTTRLDPDQVAEEAKATESKDDSESKLKRPDKKAPMKLPKMTSGPTTKNTKDAASETLKKYFGGR